MMIACSTNGPTAEFHAINRRISAVWGRAFLVGTVSLFVAGSVEYRQVLLRVVIPFGALAWAYKYSQSQAGQRPVAAQTAHQEPAGARIYPYITETQHDPVRFPLPSFAAKGYK